MRIGLIGLPRSGKSTCFSTLTGMPPGTTSTIGTVVVPEPRVDRLAQLYDSRKLVWPEIVFVDTPGLETSQGASAIERQLARLAQEADAFAMVLQCFGDFDQSGAVLDPAGDLEALFLELALADLAMVERRLERLRNQPRKERNVYDEQLVERLHEHLSAGHPAFRFAAKPEESKHLGGYQLITMRPLMVVANVGDDDLDGQKHAGVREVAEANRVPVVHFCAALEAEIAQLTAEEQDDFRRDYGVAEPARDQFVRTAYELLDVMTFLTAGPTESHAWTTRRHSKAPEAAGKIHTDMERGFIRAEVVAFADLDRYETMAECRKHGAVRLEGKDYEVKDGDILDIRFSR